MTRKPGRPREYRRKRVSTALRLDPTVHRRLHIEAARRGLSVNKLVDMALESYLPRLEKQRVTLP